MTMPKCKDLKNQVVRLHETCVTRAGEIYHKGELLVCRGMDKNGNMDLYRPGIGLRVQWDPAIQIIGDKKDIFFTTL